MNPLSQAIVSGTISGTVYVLLATGLIIAASRPRLLSILRTAKPIRSPDW